MFDYIFKNGQVADGSGDPAYRADVAVKDGKIAKIGILADAQARQVFDVSGLTVAPGFFDAHSHGDTSFLKDDRCEAKIYQGITTEITGNCGESPFPCIARRSSDKTGERLPETGYQSFEEFTDCAKRAGKKMAVNQAMLVGHGSLRDGVLGSAARKVTKEELACMCELLERDLQSGVWGYSLGLEYAPGCFGDVEEFSALAEVTAKYGGVVTCHMRSEGLAIEAAMDELMELNRRTGVHVHISHLKLDNEKVHGRAPLIWKKIEQARAEGINVTCDMYPYTASATTFVIRCPQWAIDGGDEQIVKILHSGRREEVLDFIRRRYHTPAQADTAVVFDTCGMWTEVEGLTLRQLAEDVLHTDYAEALAEILLRTNGKGNGIFFVMSQEDMMYFLHQDTMIGTDGRGFSYNREDLNGIPHPRVYGAIPEFLRLARETKMCSMEAAVHRITAKPAAMIGITDRGMVKEGMAADLTVFDPETAAPRASYQNPFQKPVGIVHVMVNGEPAVIDGKQTSFRTGKFLRKTQN